MHSFIMVPTGPNKPVKPPEWNLTSLESEEKHLSHCQSDYHIARAIIHSVFISNKS